MKSSFLAHASSNRIAGDIGVELVATEQEMYLPPLLIMR